MKGEWWTLVPWGLRSHGNRASPGDPLESKWDVLESCLSRLLEVRVSEQQFHSPELLVKISLSVLTFSFLYLFKRQLFEINCISCNSEKSFWEINMIILEPNLHWSDGIIHSHRVWSTATSYPKVICEVDYWRWLKVSYLYYQAAFGGHRLTWSDPLSQSSEHPVTL